MAQEPFRAKFFIDINDYQATKMQALAEIKPFFDWLGVTESGFRWFLAHRLSFINHLDVKPIIMEIGDKYIQMERPYQRIAKSHYITFVKGN